MSRYEFFVIIIEGLEVFECEYIEDRTGLRHRSILPAKYAPEGTRFVRRPAANGCWVT